MTGRVYYNEFDPHAADWLEGLMAAKLIPAGVVDRRSISDVLPSDLLGFRHCHFFAGIGGWAEAFIEDFMAVRMIRPEPNEFHPNAGDR